MNRDIIEGSWKQLRGRIKAGWGRLMDDQMDQIEGDYQMVCGRIQRAYGLSRHQEEKKLKKVQLRRSAVV